MGSLKLFATWLLFGSAKVDAAGKMSLGTGGLIGYGGRFLGAAGELLGLSSLQAAAVIGGLAVVTPLVIWAAYEGYQTATYNPPVVAAGKEKADHISKIQAAQEKARTSTDPAEKQSAEAAIEGLRELGVPVLPTRGDGYSIFVANNDVFVGQRSVIEDAALSTVILWGTDGSRKVKDVAQVKNALQGDRSFPTPVAALNAYQTLLKNSKRASAAFASHGKLGQFQDVPLQIGPDTVRIDTAVLVPEHWYAINNVERFLVR
jgi:hypothetical protein